MELYQLITILISIYGTILGLFIWTNNKLDVTDKRIIDGNRDIIKEIRDSNLDFHGRLSRLEGKIKEGE
jgi:hypothetical protein